MTPTPRLAVFALFRAQGAALASSAAIGGLLAQPFAEAFGFAPGEVVAAIARAIAAPRPRARRSR